MFGSTVLEIAIGMVFIYLLVSLVVTATNEMLAAFFKLRAKLLWKGIEAMLETGGIPVPGKSWTQALYNHSLIRSLFPLKAQGKVEESGPNGKGPAYIPAGSFATALLSITGVTNASIRKWESKLSARLEGIGQDATQATRVVKNMVAELNTGIAGTKLKKDLEDLAANWETNANPAQALAGITNEIDDAGLGWIKQHLTELLEKADRAAVLDASRLVPVLEDIENGALLMAQLNGLLAQIKGHPDQALQLAKSFATSITSEGARRALQALPPGDLRNVLNTLFDEAVGDLDDFKANVAAWFNQSMDRVSGWYKRQNAWINFWVGLLIVALLNVDSIAVLDHLSTDQSMRNALVAQAETYAKTAPAGGPGQEAQPAQPAPDEIQGGVDNLKSSFNDLKTHLQDLQLPIGWGAPAPGFGNSFGSVLLHLFGWLITAVAVSLGAPFWFDLLDSFMNVRMAGTRPDTDLEKENDQSGGAKPAPAPGS